MRIEIRQEDLNKFIDQRNKADGQRDLKAYLHALHPDQSFSDEEIVITGDFNGDDNKKTKYENIDFSGMKFENAKFYDINFTNCQFSKSNMEGVVLSGCNIENCNFNHANLKDAVISGFGKAGKMQEFFSKLPLPSFELGSLAKLVVAIVGLRIAQSFIADYIKEATNKTASVVNMITQDSDVAKFVTGIGAALLKGGCLFAGTLIGASLVGAVIIGMEVNKTTIKGCDLSDASLIACKMKNTTIERSNLKNAQFTGCETSASTILLGNAIDPSQSELMKIQSKIGGVNSKIDEAVHSVEEIGKKVVGAFTKKIIELSHGLKKKVTEAAKPVKESGASVLNVQEGEKPAPSPVAAKPSPPVQKEK